LLGTGGGLLNLLLVWLVGIKLGCTFVVISILALPFTSPPSSSPSCFSTRGGEKNLVCGGFVGIGGGRAV